MYINVILVPFWERRFYWNHDIVYFVAYSAVYDPINNNKIVILSHIYATNVPYNLSYAIMDWIIG